ncbi:hypothetical protein R3I94_006940 [Phoxinus phoxinus]|uniref:HECT domain-containing protein n=1 Tax=Phoxinus phoxinus TaxID=58324 RepID=A0AAN9HBS5_9TELE
MDDNTLERFLPALGDRVALRHYCGNGNHVKQTRKQNLLEKLRKKIKLGHVSNFSEDAGENEECGSTRKSLIGNKNACKDKRRVELGWMHNGKQVRTKCGGGTRKLAVPKTAGYDDLIQLGKEKNGPEVSFSFKIYDFQECEMPHDITVGGLYESVKLGVLRFYLVTLDLEKSEAASEDLQSSDTPSEQNDDCYTADETYLSSDDEIQFGPVEDPEYNSDDTLSIDEPQEEIPSQSREVAHLVTHEDSAPKMLRLHRVNIIHDMVEQFKDASVVEARLSVIFVDECGIDASGVARDAFSGFWEAFFLNCADGEIECVPALKPEYGKEEWEAVGRILLKGYQDHGFFPVKLSLAFVVCLLHGENKVTPDMLIESFVRFVTPFERDIISSVLEGKEYDRDDLLDMLSRMGGHAVPDGDAIKDTII